MVLKKIYTAAFLLLTGVYSLSAESETKLKAYFFSPDVSSLPISDWYHPSVEDYRMIQNFIRNKVKGIVDTPLSSRPFSTEFLNTEFHGWITYRMNRAELVGHEGDPTPPTRNVIHFNNDPENKKKCIITYASYPCPSPGYRDYAQGIGYIIEALKKQNFDGHFIYYIGGWPSLEKGRLKFADVPYSFKPFLFEEVKDLGYENVLWLDAACVPVKNLNPVFDLIHQNGLCYYGDHSDIPWNEFNKSYKILMAFLNLKKKYKDLVSSIVGINLKDSRGLKLLEEWIKAAESKVPFLMSDQPPFVFLVNDLNLLHGRLPPSYYVQTPCNTGNFSYKKYNPKAIIYHQYDFLNPTYKLPPDLFD